MIFDKVLTLDEPGCRVTFKLKAGQAWQHLERDALIPHQLQGCFGDQFQG